MNREVLPLKQAQTTLHVQLYGNNFPEKILKTIHHILMNAPWPDWLKNVSLTPNWLRLIRMATSRSVGKRYFLT